MELTRQHVLSVVDTYIKAWVNQDPELIVTIFTDAATYHERVLDEAIRTREGIREYWKTKVVESQGRISCKLLNTYLDGDVAIVEWEAEFDDRVEGTRKQMREIAVLVFDNGLISSLREYWSSKRIPGFDSSPATIE